MAEIQLFFSSKCTKIGDFAGGKVSEMQLTMKVDFQWEKRTVSARVRGYALNIARVFPLVDGFQRREVKSTVIRYKNSPVLLDEIWEVISGPVVLDSRKMLRRITVHRFSPILISTLLRSLQVKLQYVAKGKDDALRDDGSKHVARFAVIRSTIFFLKRE